MDVLERQKLEHCREARLGPSSENWLRRQAIQRMESKTGSPTPSKKPCRVEQAFAMMVGDPSMSEEQRRQFVLSLWSLLVTFVDLKYELKNSGAR